jgi:3-hydroxyisobutyrate dehydrogenase-like beta-hydroxyacid dehydrogenase
VPANIGFIGLGIMGSRMATSLRRAGFELVVWNRTRATAERWAARNGATVAGSPAEVGSMSEIVVTMVVDGAQVEEILLGSNGAATCPRAGLLCIDMSTIGPSAARRIDASLGERAVRFVDAPVSGSAPRAETGTLTIMAGGERTDFERAKPSLDALGGTVVHVGAVGQGQMVKLINNAVAAVNAAAVGEALLVGRESGVDLDALLRVMAAGSGASAMLDLKAPVMRAGDYTPLFKLDHMLKDVRLCLEEAKEAGVRLELVDVARAFLEDASGQGFGESDFAALMEVLAERERVNQTSFGQDR